MEEFAHPGKSRKKKKAKVTSSLMRTIAEKAHLESQTPRSKMLSILLVAAGVADCASVSRPPDLIDGRARDVLEFYARERPIQPKEFKPTEEENFLGRK